MTITASQCPKCGGTRHIRTKSGTWKRCTCVRQQIIENACIEAGIPGVLRPVPSARLAHDGTVPSLIFPIHSPVVWWVCGPATSAARVSACYYLVKVAIESGLAAVATRLSDLIDDRFIEGRPLHIAVREAHAVYVDLDGVDHKFAGPELLNLYQSRSMSNVATVFGSAADVGGQTGRYGPEMARVLSKSKNVQRFVVGVSK